MNIFMSVNRSTDKLTSEEEEIIQICEEIIVANVSEEFKGTQWYIAEKFLIRCIISLSIIEKGEYRIDSIEELGKIVNELPNNHLSKIQYIYFDGFTNVAKISAFAALMTGLQSYKEYLQQLKGNNYINYNGRKLSKKFISTISEIMFKNLN